MNLVELDQALRKLRLSGMADVLETRLRQAQAEKMVPIDLVSALVCDELLRRQDRLFARRHKLARFRDPDQPYEDLIMCERDCMRCSYAATLDCDGNCGVCPHNGYCPCVNPVVARSKTALRIIELRPILLQANGLSLHAEVAG